MPRVAEAWRDLHGLTPRDEDVQAMYDDLVPLQKTTLASHSEVISGVSAAVAECPRLGRYEQVFGRRSKVTPKVTPKVTRSKRLS